MDTPPTPAEHVQCTVIVLALPKDGRLSACVPAPLTCSSTLAPVGGSLCIGSGNATPGGDGLGRAAGFDGVAVHPPIASTAIAAAVPITARPDLISYHPVVERRCAVVGQQRGASLDHVPLAIAVVLAVVPGERVAIGTQGEPTTPSPARRHPP